MARAFHGSFKMRASKGEGAGSWSVPAGEETAEREWGSSGEEDRAKGRRRAASWGPWERQ